LSGDESRAPKPALRFAQMSSSVVQESVPSCPVHQYAESVVQRLKISITNG
jgi:hypothetical protein